MGERLSLVDEERGRRGERDRGKGRAGWWESGREGDGVSGIVTEGERGKWGLWDSGRGGEVERVTQWDSGREGEWVKVRDRETMYLSVSVSMSPNYVPR